MEEGAHLEEVLAHEAPLQDPDRSLAWFLAYGIQRCRGRVDAALRSNLRQPLEALEPPVRAALRLGSFELQFARTGQHAAVHQAVEVVKALRLARASGLVNAVLRRVRPNQAKGADAMDAPAWMYSRWGARYGREAADAWLQQATEPPPLFLVANGDADAFFDAVTAVGHAIERTETAKVFRISELRGRIEDLPGFADGSFWVQDLASVRVADLARAKAGQTILDACAAPGGKSFRMAEQGATVFAADRSQPRLDLMHDSIDRLSLDIRVKAHDWSTGAIAEAPTFDTVLVDAPCSAVGTLRRHPEIKWRRQLMDVLGMPVVQREILENAAHHVSSGGALVYAVCSPEPEEGPDVIAAFVQAHPEFTVEESFVTAPPQSGEDAFYGARLVRE